MKKLLFIFVLLITFGSGAYALEEQGTYFAVDYTAVNSDADVDDWDTGVLFGRYGYAIQPGLAVEGFIGLGIQDDSWTSSNGCDSADVSTDSFLGARIVAFKDLGGVSLHANLGLNMVTASVEISGAASCYGIGWQETYDDSEIGLTYGFGADFNISDQAAISLDFNIFYDDDYSGADLTISGLSVGYKQTF